MSTDNLTWWDRQGMGVQTAAYIGVALLLFLPFVAVKMNQRHKENREWRQTMATARAESSAIQARREAAMPCNRLEVADAEWAGMRAKDALAFAVALAALDPYCAEDQDGIAAATIAAQQRLGADGFRVSAFDMMDTIYRQTQNLRVGWSYAALSSDYADAYMSHGAARAAQAVPMLLRYPASKP